MKFLLVFSLALSLPMVAVCQTVALRNLSAPYTALEVGNTVEVEIAGAQPFGTVTLAQNGWPPVTMGQTNSNGNWSVTAVETQGHVGDYHQTWAVNGMPMTPANPNATYLPKAPTLPVFTVYSNYTGSNCAAASTVTLGCSSPGTGQRWAYSPVVVKKHSSSTISTSSIETAISQWNGTQSRVALSYAPSSPRIDVLIFDGYAHGVNGQTYVLGQDCTGCVGYTNTCTGACLTVDQVYAADVVLDMNVISTAASHLGISASNLAAYTLRHELGHALRIGHSTDFGGRCSEVKSLMYPSLSVLVGCGIIAPAPCDSSTLNSIYPSNAPYCSEFAIPWCVVPGGAC